MSFLLNRQDDNTLKIMTLVVEGNKVNIFSLFYIHTHCLYTPVYATYCFFAHKNINNLHFFLHFIICFFLPVQDHTRKLVVQSLSSMEVFYSLEVSSESWLIQKGISMVII